jgi:hypothetical protein
MREDLWLEVDGRVQWFGRTTVLEFREGDDRAAGRRFTARKLI